MNQLPYATDNHEYFINFEKGKSKMMHTKIRLHLKNLEK
jgi:hypothetical protein